MKVEPTFACIINIYFVYSNYRYLIKIFLTSLTKVASFAISFNSTSFTSECSKMIICIITLQSYEYDSKFIARQ